MECDESVSACCSDMVRLLLVAAFLAVALGEAPLGQHSRRQAFYRSNRLGANQLKEGTQSGHQGEKTCPGVSIWQP